MRPNRQGPAPAPAKQARAIELFTGMQRDGLAVVSLQVLQECFVTITAKLGVDAGVAQQKVEILARGRVVRMTESDVISAIELHRLHRISFWDALIVHAARMAGAEVLYSEDLQHGGFLGPVEIINPFAAAG